MMSSMVPQGTLATTMLLALVVSAAGVRHDRRTVLCFRIWSVVYLCFCAPTLIVIQSLGDHATLKPPVISSVLLSRGLYTESRRFTPVPEFRSKPAGNVISGAALLPV